MGIGIESKLKSESKMKWIGISIRIVISFDVFNLLQKSKSESEWNLNFSREYKLNFRELDIPISSKIRIGMGLPPEWKSFISIPISKSNCFLMHGGMASYFEKNHLENWTFPFLFPFQSLTVEVLAKKWFARPNRCFLCFSANESIDHIMLQCDYSAILKFDTQQMSDLRSPSWFDRAMAWVEAQIQESNQAQSFGCAHLGNFVAYVEREK